MMAYRIFAIFSSIIADALHRKLFYSVFLFAGAMAAAIPFLPSYGQGVVEAVFREVALALIYVFAMVVTIAYTSIRLPSEIERRTLYPLLARGVGRGEYILGTWLGISAVVGLTLFAIGAVTLAIGWINYDVLMWRVLLGVFAIWLEASVIAAVGIAVATVAGPVIVAAIALTFLFVGHVRSLLVDPGTLFYTLYPSLDTFNVINPVAHGDGYSAVYAATMLAVWLAYSAIALLVATSLFERKDL